MANVLDLRRRIRSVKNTRQITRAMKMVSAARLRRAQERALSSRPYAQMLTSVLQSLVQRTELYDPVTGEVRSPLLLEREEKNVLLVVISGDSGFAGAFNASIVKAALRFLETKSGKNVDIEAVGRKGRDQLRRRYPTTVLEKDDPQNDASQNGAPPDDTPPERQRIGAIEVVNAPYDAVERLKFDDVRKLSDFIVRRYERAEIDSVYLIYNEFKSVIAQRVVAERLLPIVKLGERDIQSAEEMSQEERTRAGEAAGTAGISVTAPDTGAADEEAKKFGTADVDYIYEQSPQEIFSRLLPRYISTQIYHAMIESVASYHAARMTAMDSATNNASDMIDSYTLQMNRARQAAITKEIIEIVSGAAAL